MTVELDQGEAAASRPAPKKPRTLREDAINLPNLLTMLRIVMIPVVLWLLHDGRPVMNFWAAIVYALAAITDALDGWLARRRGLESVLGKFLDPLADKLIVMATLVFMVDMGRIPAWAVILIVARELSITALRTIAMSEGVVIAAGQGGKDKTALQMVAVLVLIVHHPYTIDFWFFSVRADLNAVGLVLLYLSLFFAITSAGEYLGLFVEAVEAKERRIAQDAQQRAQQDKDRDAA